MRYAPRFVLVAAAAALLAPPSLAGDSRRAQHYLARGIEAMKVGEMSKAEDAFERARASDPTLPQPEVLLGQVAMARQRFDDAEGCFLRAIELFEKFDASKRLEGERDAMYTQDVLGELSSGLEESRGKPGRRGMTESDIMRQESQKDRVDQKIIRDERERAEKMAQSPVPADVFLFLGNARMRAGRPETAVDAYRDAIARAPDAAEPHHNLAAALASSGRLREALVECATAEGLGFAPSKALREQIEQALAAAAAPSPDPASPRE
jgi:tetratricopeptide (TPR) repeat protein